MFLNNLIVLVCNFCFSNSRYNKANIFLGLIEYELNSLLDVSHLVDYISIHIRFDLVRYLVNIYMGYSCICTHVCMYVSGKAFLVLNIFLGRHTPKTIFLAAQKLFRPRISRIGSQTYQQSGNARHYMEPIL